MNREDIHVGKRYRIVLNDPHHDRYEGCGTCVHYDEYGIWEFKDMIPPLAHNVTPLYFERDIVCEVNEHTLTRHFYPSSFFWKLQRNEPERVEKACKILNNMTAEQQWAVDYICRSDRLETEFNELER